MAGGGDTRREVPLTTQPACPGLRLHTISPPHPAQPSLRSPASTQAARPPATHPQPRAQRPAYTHPSRPPTRKGDEAPSLLHCHGRRLEVVLNVGDSLRQVSGKAGAAAAVVEGQGATPLSRPRGWLCACACARGWLGVGVCAAGAGCECASVNWRGRARGRGAGRQQAGRGEQRGAGWVGGSLPGWAAPALQLQLQPIPAPPASRRRHAHATRQHTPASARHQPARPTRLHSPPASRPGLQPAPHLVDVVGKKVDRFLDVAGALGKGARHICQHPRHRLRLGRGQRQAPSVSHCLQSQRHAWGGGTGEKAGWGEAGRWW